MPDFRDYIGSSSIQVADDIVHFGTPRHSGRYPYGSGDRPYQSLEKKGLFSRLKERRASKQQEKAAAEKKRKQQEAAQKAREAKQKKKEEEAEKERIVNKGNIEELNSIKDKLTPNEINNALNRIQAESRLESELARSNAEKGKQAINKIMNSNDANLILSNAQNMSSAQLNEAASKLENINRIKSADSRNKQTDTTFYKVNSAMSKVSTAESWLRTGIKVANDAVTIKKMMDKYMKTKSGE